MSSINNKVIHELESIVGKSRCMSMREDLFCYEYDGSIDKSLPLAVVLRCVWGAASSFIFLLLCGCASVDGTN